MGYATTVKGTGPHLQNRAEAPERTESLFLSVSGDLFVPTCQLLRNECRRRTFHGAKTQITVSRGLTDAQPAAEVAGFESNTTATSVITSDSAAPQIAMAGVERARLVRAKVQASRRDPGIHQHP
jgi:hypothetical protein